MQNPDHLRPLWVGDLEYIAENMRPADQEEIAHNGNPLQVLQQSVDLSAYVRVIEDEHGAPLGILGCSNTVGGYASIWMLAATGIEAYGRTLARLSRQTIDHLFDVTRAHTLVNYSHQKNEAHHRWLSWCGATLYPPKDISGKTFIPFTIKRTADV